MTKRTIMITRMTIMIMHTITSTQMITSTRMITGLRIMVTGMLTYPLTASTCEWALPWASTWYS